MQTLGALLRERREAMGVSLAEVEVATRIRQKYLSALESEEWHMLPGEVVGRGFLRNYADYLGLDAQEIMERRRATTDMGMTQALSTTSAGAPLPPEREVDYRPKEVELKDEGDGIQRGEIRLTPILGIIAVALAVGLGIWALVALREPIGEMLADARAGVTDLFSPTEAEETPTPEAVAVVNEQNSGQNQAAVMAATATAAAQGVVLLGSGSAPSESGQPSQPAANEGAQPPAPTAQEQAVILVPTATPEQVAGDTANAATAVVLEPTPTVEVPTPTPEIPTPTPEPPTPEPPTPTPELLPTETPTPEPTPLPAVVAAACGDPRSVISAPGVGQVLAGVAAISGVATHESFQFYKLEYAPGANAGGGFTYFSGGQVQIPGGVLGNLDTSVLPNGDYTIRLTVVDTVGNFPPPCDVSVVVQN